jgi:hypothetical protein
VAGQLGDVRRGRRRVQGPCTAAELTHVGGWLPGAQPRSCEDNCCLYSTVLAIACVVPPLAESTRRSLGRPPPILKWHFPLGPMTLLELLGLPRRRYSALSAGQSSGEHHWRLTAVRSIDGVQVGALPIAGAGMPASCPPVLLSPQRQQVAALSKQANKHLAAKQPTDAAMSTFTTTCTCRRRGAADPRVAAVVQYFKRKEGVRPLSANFNGVENLEVRARTLTSASHRVHVWCTQDPCAVLCREGSEGQC